MLSTLIFLALMFGVLIVYVLLYGLLLRFGLRWVKAERASARRVLVAVGLILILSVVVNAVFAIMPTPEGLAPILIAVLQFACSALAAVLVIARLFSIRIPRAIKAWLPTLLAPVATVLCLLFVLRPLLYETYAANAMSMAPTLVGEHWLVTCPECGQDSYTSPDSWHMICEDYSITRHNAIQEQAFESPDRFLVAKFLKPRRWDLLVFKAPEDPSMIFVKRVVGMPGETIHFENDFFWINGQKQTPPDSMGGLQYGPHFTDYWEPYMWGASEQPATLADDEYFVVGDFSAASRDSRDWRDGADGHNPYAVPTSHVIGVVTHRFGPFRRFKIFR